MNKNKLNAGHPLANSAMLVAAQPVIPDAVLTCFASCMYGVQVNTVILVTAETAGGQSKGG